MYLDTIIDRMETQHANFEQMRQNRPRRRDSNEPNDPNRPRGPFGGGRAPTAANMRSMSERGTALQRARLEAFWDAMRKRMQERGISMRGSGGRGGRGGFGRP